GAGGDVGEAIAEVHALGDAHDADRDRGELDGIGGGGDVDDVEHVVGGGTGEDDGPVALDGDVEGAAGHQAAAELHGGVGGDVDDVEAAAGADEVGQGAGDGDVAHDAGEGEAAGEGGQARVAEVDDLEAVAAVADIGAGAGAV